MKINLLSGPYAVHRLLPGSPWPSGLDSLEFFSLTAAPGELSLVCPVEIQVESQKVEGPWRVLQVVGPLAFNLTGILAGISGVLAAAEVSLFAISTYDTDYILVTEQQLPQALQALAEAGYDLGIE